MKDCMGQRFCNAVVVMACQPANHLNGKYSKICLPETAHEPPQQFHKQSLFNFTVSKSLVMLCDV